MVERFLSGVRGLIKRFSIEQLYHEPYTGVGLVLLLKNSAQSFIFGQ